MVEFLKKLWTALKHNLVWKILSLVFAIVIWGWVVSETNPNLNKVITNVQVQVQGREALASKGLALDLDQAELPKRVNVAVSVPLHDYDLVHKDNITVILDLSRISSTGTHQVAMEIKSPSTAEVIPDASHTVELHVDELSTRKIPVGLSMPGTLNATLWMGEAVLTPSVLEVAGPMAQVMRIARAEISYPQSSIKGSVNVSQNYILYDQDDNEIVKTENFDIDYQNILLEIPVYKRKSVSANVVDRIVGHLDLAEGLELQYANLSVISVEVAASDEILNDLTTIYTKPVDISKLPLGDTVVPVELDLPGEVYLTDAMQVTYFATIRIREKQYSRTFSDMPIELVNIEPGLHAVIKGGAAADIEVEGIKEELDLIERSRFKLEASLKGLGVGTHQVELKVEVLPNEDGYMPSWSTSVRCKTTSVEVEITQ